MNKSTIFRNSWLWLLLAFLFDLAVITGVYLLGTLRQIPLGEITRDPAATTHHIFIGMMTYLCIILWSVTAAFCFFGSYLLYEIRDKFKFLFISALFTTVLTLDDAFVLHEEIIPRLLHVHEIYVYLGYVLLIVLYLVFFLRFIYKNTSYVLFALALGFFGASIISDAFFDTLPTLALQPLVEDGLKLIGITLWLVYFSLTVASFSKQNLMVKAQSHT